MALRLFNKHQSPFNWEIDDPFDNMLVNPSVSSGLSMAPQMSSDLIETDEDFTLSAYMPGAQNLDVSIYKDVVMVQAESKHENQQSDGDTFHAVEQSYGKTQRKFRVPEEADADKAEAKFVDGVLTVTFPKKKPLIANESRNLDIKYDEGSEVSSD